MLPTLRSTGSALRDMQVVSKIFPVACENNERYSRKHSQRIPVSIEGTDIIWTGLTESLTRSNLRVILEGCPLVVMSQSVQLQIATSLHHIELLGFVQKITPIGHEVAGHWARVQIDISYEVLDDVSWQRVNSIIRDATSSYINGKLVPLDSGDCLWKMKPESPTDCVVTDHASMHRRVELVIQKIFQSTESGKLHDLHLDLEKKIHTDDLEVPIVSTAIEFLNPSGQLIQAYYDAPREPLASHSPVIVLSPGYGETKREYIMLAYYFASNGFHVLRYDHTNHVGVSDGDHVHTTLSHMKQDLDAVVTYAAQRWPQSARGLVATSLSGRVAIKAIAHRTHVDLLILITPVVDVEQTLQVVHQEDLVGNYQRGERKGESNVLGFNVSVDRWLADAVHEDFSDISSSIEDVSAIRTPVVIVSAEHDAWVQHASLNTISATLGSQLRAWYVIPEGLHRILENPRKAKLVYRQITKHCQQSLGVLPKIPFLVEPTRKTIGIQNKREREHMKAGIMADELSEFWKDYLAHFHHIVNYGDYQQLLDHMVRLMGSVSSGDTILDAGCGNGNFAPFFYLREHMKSQSRTHKAPTQLQYVGIDFIPTALEQAQKNIQTVTARNQSDSVTMDSTFSCTNLNEPLPFQNDSFDKVVSNLVLGYLDDPVATLRELFRVLAPNGTLVLSNLKPNSDLSVIYTNSVQETTKSEEVEEARQLLSNSGKIRKAEGDGVFQFHDEEDLRHLFQQIDPTSSPRVYSTFANQAYIAVIKKEAHETAKPNISMRVLANAA